MGLFPPFCILFRFVPHPLDQRLDRRLIPLQFVRDLRDGSVSYTHLDVYKRQDIWLGGILYCIVIYSLMLYYLIKINKIKTSKDKNILTFIQYTLLFCAIFLNVKMYIVSLNGFSNLFLILIIYIVYGKDKTHKLTKN